MVKSGEKTKWADFLLWVNILLRFPPVDKSASERQLGPSINHNIIMGPEPDQPTPTPSCDQAATTHDTGKRTKKSEMEDVYTWVIPRKSVRPIDTISGS